MSISYCSSCGSPNKSLGSVVNFCNSCGESLTKKFETASIKQKPIKRRVVIESDDDEYEVDSSTIDISKLDIEVTLEPRDFINRLQLGQMTSAEKENKGYRLSKKDVKARAESMRAKQGAPVKFVDVGGVE